MEAIYVISDVLNSKNNKYKIGRHSGPQSKLLSRYRTYFPNPVIYFYFETESDSSEIEKIIHQKLDQYRIKNDNENNSEWFNCSLFSIIKNILELVPENSLYINLQDVKIIIDKYENIKSTSNLITNSTDLVNFDNLNSPANSANFINFVNSNSPNSPDSPKLSNSSNSSTKEEIEELNSSDYESAEENVNISDTETKFLLDDFDNDNEIENLDTEIIKNTESEIQQVLVNFISEKSKTISSENLNQIQIDISKSNSTLEEVKPVKPKKNNVKKINLESKKINLESRKIKLQQEKEKLKIEKEKLKLEKIKIKEKMDKINTKNTSKQPQKSKVTNSQNFLLENLSSGTMEEQPDKTKISKNKTKSQAILNRCEHFTRTGERCKLIKTSESIYCYVHS